ncbi:outer membrane beta-barrel family protein [Portibacter marinus]|uniref:outer membrane beta-barrel family protein n=1 Tax=Portibacter marinus TaxID=2898660 RepID=UPI001F1F0402|nr:outer membrane beta-barrel family protein [Portibacter marinus]
MAGYGFREKIMPSLSINYRKRRFNLFGNISASYDNFAEFQVDHFRSYDYEGIDYFFTNYFTFKNGIHRGGNANIGFDYEISDKTFLGVEIGLNINEMSTENALSESEFYENRMLVDNYENLLNNSTSNNLTNYNTNLNHSFKNGSILTADFSHANYKAINSGALLTSKGNPFQDNGRKSRFIITTAQIDYSHQFNHLSKIEIGTKVTLNNFNSVVSFSDLINNEWVERPAFRREDEIYESVIAAYASYYHKFSDQWTLDAGFRFEQYSFDLDAIRSAENLEISLNNPFPILRINYEIDSIQSLNLTLNRRSNRPTFSQLAAFQIVFDPTLLVESNNQLRPAFTNSARLSYRLKNLLFSVEGNDTRNYIGYDNTVIKSERRLTSTPINLDKVQSIIGSISFIMYFTRWLEANTTYTGGYYTIFDKSNRPIPFKKDIFTHNIQLTTTADLGKGMTSTFTFNYQTPAIAGDQIYQTYPSIAFGLSKKFGSSSLIFNLQDVLNAAATIDWEYNQETLGIRT